MIQIKINPRDVGFSGFLTLKSVIDFLISAACEDADKKGIGLETISKSGYSWVLSGLTVEIITLPKIGTDICINTWLEKINRIYSYRHFELLDQKGDVMIKATSNWSIIDLKERKLANITKVIDVSSVVTSRPLNLKPVERILKLENAQEFFHKVVYSDIDMNNHATSSKYVEWVCDTIKNPFEKLTKIKRLDISYLNESLLGQNISIFHKEENDRSIFLLKNSNDDVVCNIILSFIEVR